MESPVQQAMQAVSDALNFDSNHKSREAYIRYLQCLQLIVHSLLKDAYQQVILGPGIPQKLIRLGQQSLDRVASLVDEIDQPSDTGQSLHSQEMMSQTPPMTPLTPTLPTFQPIGTNDGTDAGVRRRPKALTPLEMAQRQNQQLMAAYKARLARMQKYKPNYTNLNLTLQRKLAENMAIAKAREEALAKKMKERQKRLEEQAASRFVASPGMSKDELERRQLYTEILEYEHDAKWPLSFREQLKTNPEDPKLMQDFIKTILSYGEHPLTKMIAKIQTSIYKKLQPLCNEFIGELEHVKVPFVSNKPEQTQITNKNGASDEKQPQQRVSTESVKDTSATEVSQETKDFSEVVQENKNDIEEALEANERVVKRLSIEQEKVDDILHEIKDDKTQASGEDVQMGDGPCLSKIDEENLVELKLKHLQQEALERHLQYIVKDIHKALDRVLTMFIVAYETLDSPMGRDVTYVNIEEPCFKAIWPFLLSLYRFVNRKTEETLAEIMTKNMNLSAEDMGIKVKFLPLSAKHTCPFAPAVIEICKLTTLVCPLSKLECIVKMVRTICQCVLEYDKTNPVEGLPNLGADDLLPIMMFVIVRSSLPQLVSECHVMEEFVHEGYLMGEEGYCLTTLQTAIGYMTHLSGLGSLAL